jgi:hypothetical protein
MLNPIYALYAENLLGDIFEYVMDVRNISIRKTMAACQEDISKVKLYCIFFFFLIDTI